MCCMCRTLASFIRVIFCPSSPPSKAGTCPDDDDVYICIGICIGIGIGIGTDAGADPEGDDKEGAGAAGVVDATIGIEAEVEAETGAGTWIEDAGDADAPGVPDATAAAAAVTTVAALPHSPLLWGDDTRAARGL